MRDATTAARVEAAPETWADALRARRARVSRDGIRHWLVVCGVVTVVLATLGGLSLTVADPSSARLRMIAGFGVGLCCAFLGVLGDERTDGEDRLLAIGALLAAALVVSWHSVSTPGGHEHLLLALLGMSFAFLVPVTRGIGLAVLAAAHLTWPALALTIGGAHATDFTFANIVADLCASACIGAVALYVHQWLYDGRSRSLAELARLAEIDGLTGALNRRTIMDRLARESERAKRYGGRCALVMYDVDRFKRFNTDHGFAAGDRMLVHVVETLAGVLTRPRYERLDGWLGRYGGEEFIVILPGASLEDARAFAEDSRAAIARAEVALPSGHRVKTSTSVGLYLIEGRERLSAGAALRAADAAMYRAKGAGGDRVEIATPADAAHGVTQPGILAPPQVVKLPTTDADAAGFGSMGSIHATLLRGVLALAGSWTLLFALRDIAFWLEGGRVDDPRALLLMRVAVASAALLTAGLSPRLHERPMRALWVHGSFGVIGVVAVLASMAATGGLASPHFGALVWLLLAWSLAFAAPQALAFGLTIFATLGLLAVIELTPHDVTMHMRTQSVALLVLTGLVTIGAERRFARLRADEAIARDQLERLARVDPLTGLPNRGAFLRRAARLVRRAGPDAPVSVILFDLDHFKRLNDELGHLAGDEALTRVAAITEETIRIADVAGRLGGEEFVALLPHTDAAGSARVAERLREALERVVLSDGITRLSASFGVASWRQDETVAQMLARADVALRDAKRGGRNRVVTAEGERRDD